MSYLGVPEVGDLGLDVVHLHLVRGVEEHGDHPVRLLDPLDAGHPPVLIPPLPVTQTSVELKVAVSVEIKFLPLLPVLLVNHNPHTH